MDPVTTAIVNFLAAGVGAGFTEASKTVAVDAYGKLKDLIAKKTGEESELTNAINQLEKKPDSASRKGVVQEEIEDAGISGDPEIFTLAQKLVELIESHGKAGQSVIQIAIGEGNEQQGIVSISVNSRPSKS